MCVAGCSACSVARCPSTSSVACGTSTFATARPRSSELPVAFSPSSSAHCSQRTSVQRHSCSHTLRSETRCTHTTLTQHTPHTPHTLFPHSLLHTLLQTMLLTLHSLHSRAKVGVTVGVGVALLQ